MQSTRVLDRAQRPIDTPSRPSHLDVLGMTLVAALATWIFVAALASGGDPIPGALTLGGSAAALIVARMVSSIRRLLVPALVVGAAGTLILVDPSGIFTAAPRAGPFGFSSITGAFYLQGAVGGLMLAARSPTAWGKSAGVLAAILFSAVPIFTETRAAVILLLVLAVPVALLRRTGRRGFIVACGVVFAAALLTSIALGATYGDGDRRGTVDTFVDSTLTERRVGLWQEAIAMTVDSPLTGVGPGRFRFHSELIREDADVPWAHNDLLQQGAETGVPGFLLLTSLFAWGFVRLRARIAGSVMPVLGAVSLAALGVHACIEYVLQRPAVPIVAAAILGSAIGPRKRFDTPRRPRPR